ncbi:MAG: SDR family oxidoreductase [Bacteroidetes bacterium]|nr:SDR family oxidoreductase [Bacteroidota bacterium]
MKVFVTGANGFLGQHLVKSLLEKNFQVIATGKDVSRLLFNDKNYAYFSLDITNEKAVENMLSDEKPDIVIHTAAMTRVDDCEQNQNECFKINVLGTSFVVRSAEKYARHFIHISTDFVFDGEKGNYKEDDPLGYVNWYGFTKIEAEQLVKSSVIPWSIARTCLVYGNALYGTRSNIISWTKSKLEKKEKIKVVDDQVRTPTYVGDLAQGITAILEKKATGIFHISGREILTPYIMSMRTADFFSLDKNLIERVNASNFSEPAKRPPKTGFVIDKAVKELGFDPISFDEGLKLMF